VTNQDFQSGSCRLRREFHFSRTIVLYPAVQIGYIWSYVLWTGLCSDCQTLRFYEYGTDLRFVNDGVFSNFGDRTLPSRQLNMVRCTVRCQAGTANAKMASERPLHPKTSHFHLLYATQCFPEQPWGWGCISSGEGPSSGLHGNFKLVRYHKYGQNCSSTAWPHKFSLV